MTFSPRILWAMLLMTGATTVGAQEPKVPDAPAVPKEVSLAAVISLLRKEATQAWGGKEPWPRTEPDFAQSKGWSLPLEQVAKGLTGRLHPEPPVDAYIKWQLLSFVDDLEPLGAAGMDRVIRAMPRPIPQPTAKLNEWLPKILREIAPVQTEPLPATPYVRPKVAVAPFTVGIGAQITTIAPGVTVTQLGDVKEQVAARASQMLEEERDETARRNLSILSYRSSLIGRMPPKDGLRLGLMIRDAAQRLDAGDPSLKDAVKSLVQATGEMKTDLSSQSRPVIIGAVRELGKRRGQVHDRVVAGKRKNSLVVVAREVAVPEYDIRLLLEQLAQTDP